MQFTKANIATVILVFLFGLLVISIIVVLILATKQSNSKKCGRPSDFDVILIDRGRQRASFQITAIDKYMPWVNSIILVKLPDPVDYSCVLPESVKEVKSQTPVIHIKSTSNDYPYILMNIKKKYSNIQDNVIFFGDTTFPIKPMTSSCFWSSSRKQRLFNYFHPDANSIGLQEYFEYSLPVTIINIPTLNRSTSLKNYLLSLTLSNDLVYSPTINQTILLINNEFADGHQLESRPESQHYFCTIFIKPDEKPEIQQYLNQKIINFLQ